MNSIVLKNEECFKVNTMFQHLLQMPTQIKTNRLKMYIYVNGSSLFGLVAHLCMERVGEPLLLLLAAHFVIIIALFWTIKPTLTIFAHKCTYRIVF